MAAATLADMYAAATAAIATLQGPLHGGAITEVREMLEEIGTPDLRPPSGCGRSWPARRR